MAHGVGDVEADVPFIQAKDVVKVAADPAAQQVMDREADVRDLGQRLRQEARLDALGQLQFLIDLLIGLLQAFVDAMELGRLLGEPIVQLP